MNKAKTTEEKPKTKRIVAEENSNISFVGKHINSNGRLVKNTAPASIIIGGKHIKLPSSEQQIVGFYHKDAALIIRQYRSLYKQFEVAVRKEKGGK